MLLVTMLHSVPFDSSLKTDPPPLPDVDHSIKRAKLDDVDSMDSTEILDSISPESLVSALPLSKFVPETPLPAANPAKQDIHMSDGIDAPGPKAPSFKDKLLNSEPIPAEEEEDDLVLKQSDVSIGLNGNVRPQLILLLMTHEHVINQVVGWVRLPKLPARYYHKSIIRSIGSVFGEVIKVDYNTDSGDRGKFARLAVNIVLTKPLISKIQVDGEIIFVEYEGLPMICFNCGRYGHLQDSCPEKMISREGESPDVAIPATHEIPLPKQALQERESVNFGDWMLVQRRPRRTMDKAIKKNTPYDGRIPASISRYEVLNEMDPQVEDRQEPTSLERDHNSAVLVRDTRVPQENNNLKAKSDGPFPLPNPGNGLLSNSRGIKLASGVSLHNMGAKPNPHSVGPTVRLMKEMARELHCNLEGTECAIIPEGVIHNPSSST
ncbi:hypothetical protein K1719_010133 [Acacia pycnantha]|nr:hypothetical protein K1719_010133 [Acacia pycnantha]